MARATPASASAKDLQVINDLLLQLKANLAERDLNFVLHKIIVLQLIGDGAATDWMNSKCKYYL